MNHTHFRCDVGDRFKNCSVVTIASEPALIDYDRSFEKDRDVDVDSMLHGQLNNDAIIVIAGDLNRLNCAKLESDCGLSQLVDLNTRGSVTLDKFLTNRPDLFQSVSVFSSIVKTDHKAVLVKPTASQSSDLPRRNTQAHVKSVMYNHSPVHIGNFNLCKAFRELFLDWFPVSC